MKIAGLWLILLLESLCVGLACWLIFTAIRDWHNMGGWAKMGGLLFVAPIFIFAPLILFTIPLSTIYRGDRSKPSKIGRGIAWTIAGLGALYFFITITSRVTHGTC